MNKSLPIFIIGVVFCILAGVLILLGCTEKISAGFAWFGAILGVPSGIAVILSGAWTYIHFDDKKEIPASTEAHEKRRDTPDSRGFGTSKGAEKKRSEERQRLDKKPLSKDTKTPDKKDSSASSRENPSAKPSTTSSVEGIKKL